MNDGQPILPGATVGVLGSGQLGRMFAMAARRMGYRVHTFSPDRDTPTGHVADVETVADYLDLDAVKRFAHGVDVVTFEFENIPAATARTAAEHAPVRPDGVILQTTQNRAREKAFLAGHGLPVTPHRVVKSLDELRSAIETLGTPGVLKTASWGYDGKGQIKIDSADQAADAWAGLNTDEAVLEAFIDFQCEVSVVAARDLAGNFRAFPLAMNDHANHILDVSVAPAPLEQAIHEQADQITRAVFEAFDAVGVMCVEYFVTAGGELMINEIAPRTHNSGHLTIEGNRTSQFEQQLRAVCGLPLGSTQIIRPTAMANLLGDLWADGEPAWARLLADPHAVLHLYGKAEARSGRKMGHMTARGDTPPQARQRVIAARRLIARD